MTGVGDALKTDDGAISRKGVEGTEMLVFDLPGD